MVDDFKKAKANIYLFELLQIPSIRENLPKNMILNKSREVQNNNLETFAKPDSQNPNMKRVPPFLFTFEIFNSNAHNCMIDSGESYNVMPIYVCRKLNATWEYSPTQIVQLDRSRVKVVSELKNVLLTLYVDHRIHQTVDIAVVDIP